MRSKNNRKDEHLLIRMPKELKEKIQYLAKLNDRSMNAEIIFRLKKTLIEEEIDNALLDG